MFKDTVDSKKRSSRGLFFSGVLVLTIANILVKSVGLISKIALNRIVGSIGAGYYSSAYEIYAFLYVISTAGLPVAISITVARSLALERNDEVNRIFNTAFKVFMTMGLALSGLMILFSSKIADYMGAPETRLCIIGIAPTVFFVCISSCIRGYFQGHRLMGPTAVSQIIEAICKVGIGVGGAVYAKGRGFDDHVVAAYTILGVTFGVFLGMVYLYIKKMRFKARRNEGEILTSDKANGSKSILSDLLKIAIPVTVSSSVLSLTTVLDTFMIQRRLMDFGMDVTTVRVYYGDYTSLVVSMFNLPTILLYPIANALVPLISACRESKDDKGQTRLMGVSIRLIAIIALPCAIGMSVFSGPILRLLMFKHSSAERAAPWLSVAALSIIFLGVIAITNAFLNSAGKQRLPIFSMLLGAFVKLSANYLLIGRFGIIGAPIGTVLCYMLASSFNIYFVIKNGGVMPSVRGVFVKPFICSVISVGLAAGLYIILTDFLAEPIVTLLAIFLAVLVYGITVIKTKTVSEEEILLAPNGKNIVKILKVVKLL